MHIDFVQYVCWGHMWESQCCFQMQGEGGVGWGANTEFFDRRFKFANGDTIWSIYPPFLKIPHDNEIIWIQRGFHTQPPSGIRHWNNYLFH